MKFHQKILLIASFSLLIMSSCQCGDCVVPPEEIVACHDNPGYYYDYETCACVKD